MKRQRSHKLAFLVFLVAAALVFLGTARSMVRSGSGTDDPAMKSVIVSLKDFTKDEVKGAGIVLAKDTKVHISSLGGGDRSFWRDAFDDNESQQMYAVGWIIDADSREIVWDMTMDNTSGKPNRRSFEGDLVLKRGSYEVYYAAYGYTTGGSFSHVSINIDRRKTHRSYDRVLGGLLDMFRGDEGALYDEFMEYAKDTWGITLTVADENKSDIQSFGVPRTDKRAIVSGTRVGDNVVYRKDIRADKTVKVHVYALGEGRQNEDLFDYGWLVNADTRERIWDMNLKEVTHAGGASKNIKYDGDVTLQKGVYELYYVTDGSHSTDDWNARPPYDPFNYGVTLSALEERDLGGIKIVEPADKDENLVVKLTEMRDDDYKSAGFSLKKEMSLRIYALGESENDNKRMADYGWITNANTHERVWSMERGNTYHAGGASKNRLSDEIITLPKGDYVAYFQTDGSHSFQNWNADPPFDPEHWGLTIIGVGKDFDAKSISAFSEDDEEGVIAQLIRVRDDKHVRQRFTIPSRTKVRVYALGESEDEDMADYGWIKNTQTGRTVWEMEYDGTEWAGGAKKNRLVNTTITLDEGEYELHFKTDGSHAFGDWNDDPPEDRTHWGITIYKGK